MIIWMTLNNKYCPKNNTRKNQEHARAAKFASFAVIFGRDTSLNRQNETMRKKNNQRNMHKNDEIGWVESMSGGSMCGLKATHEFNGETMLIDLNWIAVGTRLTVHFNWMMNLERLYDSRCLLIHRYKTSTDVDTKTKPNKNLITQSARWEVSVTGNHTPNRSKGAQIMQHSVQRAR